MLLQAGPQTYTEEDKDKTEHRSPIVRETTERDPGALRSRRAREATVDVLIDNQMNRMPDSQRLDVWLDVACLFRTRSEAQKACKGGKVDVNGQSAKPHRDVRVGDTIEITRPLGKRQHVIVRALAERHIPRAEARQLYEDVTPPPTPEEVEARRLDRLTRALNRPVPGRSPDKRERRALRRLKERT